MWLCVMVAVVCMWCCGVACVVGIVICKMNQVGGSCDGVHYMLLCCMVRNVI